MNRCIYSLHVAGLLLLPLAGRSDQKSAAAKVDQLGGQVLSIAKDSPNVRVTIPGKTLDGKVLKDADLAVLTEITNIVELDIKGADVTDAGLEHLKGLTALEVLHLEKTKVADAGLAALKGMQNLQYLNLYGTAVTDAGLDQLKAFKKLRKLFLWETKVTEEAAKKYHEAMESSGNDSLDINLGLDKEIWGSKRIAFLKAQRAALEAAAAAPPKVAEAKPKEVEVVDKPVYATHIQPLLQASCVKCHGPEKQKAKLRLDSLEELLKGSKEGPILVAGKPDESKILKLLSLPPSSDERMPPEGDPLPASQIALIKNWISTGAK